MTAEQSAVTDDKEAISLSISETNDLRIKLGLKPLNSDKRTTKSKKSKQEFDRWYAYI